MFINLNKRYYLYLLYGRENRMLNIKRVHPGLLLKDELEAMEISIEDFSIKSGITQEKLVGIINGKDDITLGIAEKLAETFDSSIELWINAQEAYNAYCNN